MKKITIIGGGISGLTVLHYLKQRLGNGVEITLFEREASTGGTIRSIKQDSSLFEWGPNGFLDNQPATLQLIEELGITDKLIEAQPIARSRFIQVKGELQAVPMGPFELIGTSLLSLNDKWSLLTGLFKNNISQDLSIHEYVSQRFSVNIAESLVDPMISGIYAGNTRRLHMDTAFPKFKKKGFKRSTMHSFTGGMGQIIEALTTRYKQHIQTNVETPFMASLEHTTIIATPAWSASRIIELINPNLSKLLDQVPYAPVAVAGLVFKGESFKKRPEGFGYLVPSRENKDILGVLIESNVYQGRAKKNEILLRVMLGGAHHPGIINDSPEQIIAKAILEIDNTYGIVSQPTVTFVKQWPKAIPQYETNYPTLRRSIAEECDRTPGLYLCANYLDGISFNDCINNAKSLTASL